MDRAGPREGLLAFLDVIWGERGTAEVNHDTVRNGEDADYVCVATIDANKSLKRTMWQWPLDSANIASKIFKESAARLEVYVLPATFKTPNSARKDNFKKSHTVWVDFDGNAPELWDESLHGIPRPTMRVISSTADRQHCYWKLNEPCYNSVELESRTRTLAYTLEADVGGWDCVQLLRPPYTTNFGYAKPDRKGKTHDVVVDELIIDRKYNITDFGVMEDLVSHVSSYEDKMTSVVKMLAFNKWDDQLLDDWDHVPEEGSKKRSDALVSMAHQAAELGWTGEGIYSLVFHMDEKIGKYKARSDRFTRLNDIVDRVLIKHRKDNAENISVEQPDDLLLHGLSNMEFNFKWIVEGLMPKKSLGLLVSQPGVGKTTLALRMSMAISANEDTLLGHLVVDHDDERPVMFFSLEIAAGNLSKFVKDMHLTDEDEFKYRNCRVLATGKEIFLDTPEGRQFFEDILKKRRPKLIFLDSLNKIIRKSIADDDAIRVLMIYLNQIIEDFDLSIVILHHDRKRQQGQSTTELDDVYGSRFLTTEADFVTVISKTADINELSLHYPKMRFGDPQPPKLIRRIENLDFKVVERLHHDHVRHEPLREPSSGDSDEPSGPLWDEQ